MPSHEQLAAIELAVQIISEKLSETHNVQTYSLGTINSTVTCAGCGFTFLSGENHTCPTTPRFDPLRGY